MTDSIVRGPLDEEEIKRLEKMIKMILLTNCTDARCGVVALVDTVEALLTEIIAKQNEVERKKWLKITNTQFAKMMLRIEKSTKSKDNDGLY